MSLIALPKVSTDSGEVCWPCLDQLRLSAGTLEERRLGVGGSDANVILSGNPERVRDLWLEKRGEAEAVDLSQYLQVMLGCWTEPFNRQWFERASGHNVERIGETIRCKRHSWRQCTLDGFIEEGPAVWEAKHTNAFSSMEDVLDRYMPQLQHNMSITGAERAFLSVIFGNHKFEAIEVAADWLYQLDLVEAEAEFWDCVVTGREPVAAPVPLSPKPIGVREVCLEGNNAWAAAAADWLDNRDAAKMHAIASKALKEIVEPDVVRAFGHGIEAKRSKSGAITIRELGQ